MKLIIHFLIFLLFKNLSLGQIQRPISTNNTYDNFITNHINRIGDNPFPSNPMNDRARGYLLKGKAQTALSNYGNFIDFDIKPNGAWGEYAYLYDVSFLAGIPGNKNSSNFSWTLVETLIEDDQAIYSIWESQNAFDEWFQNNDTTFKGIIFNCDNDYGIWEPDSISRKYSIDQFTKEFQWMIDEQNKKVIISSFAEINPNKSSARIGLIYPWALRPKLISREEQFDYYDYGNDQEEWTQDDNYYYYGANTAESCLTYYNPTSNTDWHASTMARINTHNTEISAGDLFGNTYVTDYNDSYPLLAHSAYGSTWPKKWNPTLGKLEPFWPGSWAKNYNINLPGCSESRKDPDCWEEALGRFTSDMDVYMEFDDRWAHRGNQVNTNNEYEQTGYPMGLRVMSEAHSYGVSYAEDILFVTVTVRNESGDWCANDEFGDPILDKDGNLICGEAMIMPDGTKLNKGKGFNYAGVSLGFWNDGVIVSGDKYGNTNTWTSADDYMKYYWEIFELNNERHLISMAMIGDYDGNSVVSGYAMDPDTPSPGNQFGLVATQLLDSPKATLPIDLDKDGIIDIFPGEPLKMTDWHWVDWYLRPGVTHPESLSGDCYAGTPGCPQARNKEELFYKIMIGDTSNLSENEKAWHFHTANPGTDSPLDLNPHFDSLEGIEEEAVFQRPPDGVDPLVIMSCGPFDLPVGREVPFSFCIIFGQNEEDLINNARFAQVMYNSKYQGFTPPSRPNVYVESQRGKIKLYWDNIAESSKDIVTGYADFEGYKIYKSIDGGETWGSSEDMIYDSDGIFVGWRPYAQFDLSAEEDSLHCVYSNNPLDCEGNYKQQRGHSISGQDNYFPWFNLGNDTGFDEIRLTEKVKFNDIEYSYLFEDEDIIDGFEYTYSVVAYDMGVEPPYRQVYDKINDNQFETRIDTNFSNPSKWADPKGYASIENSKGTTILDKNFVQVFPGAKPSKNLKNVKVVPNPYIVNSNFNETEHLRRIRFTNITENCEIKIFTLNGELINIIHHNNKDSGNIFWDLRSINNQEVVPGLYLYHVTSKKNNQESIIGKFAIIR